MVKTKRNKTNGKGIDSILGTKNMRCPKCGRAVELRSAQGIYKDNADKKLYVCTGYPECDTYARVHSGTAIPMGSLADGKLRSLRNDAHKHFDRLHQFGFMDREDAYSWLAGILSAPMSKAHIGNLTEYYCQVVIEESDKLFDQLKQRAANKFRPASRGGELYVVV